LDLVNRIAMPLTDTPGQVTGLPGVPNPIRGDGGTGLGDINYSLFLSPVKVGKVIWGVGPSITMPTATNEHRQFAHSRNPHVRHRNETVAALTGLR
jgi:hypothetical protein